MNEKSREQVVEHENPCNDRICREHDNCPTEGAVLQREWRQKTETIVMLIDALENVLSTHSAERKAELSLDTATENYSDHNPELDAYTEATAASSRAEEKARVAIQKAKDALK